MLDQALQIIRRHWGFDELRPLQQQAIVSALHKRDSLVVLPTGGGKSLCYQVPPLVDNQLTVVVSPLISLMKDQVDSLRVSGIDAYKIDSSQSSSDTAECRRKLLDNSVRILFVSPERLMNVDFCELLRRVGVSRFAIDEAHCISQWGHDFRPEYRQLSRLKEMFPGVSVHAYTATATRAVREDIVSQLNMAAAEVLVGDFDRPNLIYRVIPRRDSVDQVMDVIGRHEGEPGIIYCISRREVDALTKALKDRKLKVVAYHAGMDANARTKAQDAFATEKADIVVATVAFGMGIDRSNVRFVMHTGMPKSLECYQQETGRAGRDGLDAECVLLFSIGDLLQWQSIIEKSAANSEVEVDPEYLQTARGHLDLMARYCRAAICRHKSLVEHFGQAWSKDNCGACDVCCGDTAPMDNSDDIAKKILSCVARVKGRFGAGYIVSVLRGENVVTVRNRNHDQLSTFGLMSDYGATEIRDWIDQLIGQGALEQENLKLSTGTTVRVIALNPESWKVMRGESSAKLLASLPSSGSKRKPKIEKSWDGVDQQLFEVLRTLRRELATERKWQAYMVFSDATLREMARVKPSNLEDLHKISGVGAAKLQQFGPQFLDAIQTHCFGTAPDLATTTVL